MRGRITQEPLSKLPHRYQVYFTIFCAEQVFHLIPEQHKAVCLVSINTAKKWCIGEASAEECRVAATNAAANAAYATNAAAYAAANAANAAYYAAYAAYYAAADAAATNAAEAAKQTIIDAQWEYYEELLHLDENIEKIVLCC